MFKMAVNFDEHFDMKMDPDKMYCIVDPDKKLIVS